MRKSTIYLFVLGVAVVVMTALASAGLVVSAQNSNSSMTMAPTNESKPKRCLQNFRGGSASTILLFRGTAQRKNDGYIT